MLSHNETQVLMDCLVFSVVISLCGHCNHHFPPAFQKWPKRGIFKEKMKFKHSLKLHIYQTIKDHEMPFLYVANN